jgi:hypothetical protein
MEMFKSKLYNISKDLQAHKRNRGSVMEQAIADRLNESLKSYVHDLDVSYSYLEGRSPNRMYGRLSRRKK